VIFVTVGTQKPFDRLVSAVDGWAASRGRRDVFAQIAAGGTPPASIESVPMLPHDAHEHRLATADLVVAHAGIGTILHVLELGKPLVVMPRRAVMGEHRNDHQLATADRFADFPGIAIAADEVQLVAILDRPPAALGVGVRRHASPELLDAVRSFLSAGVEPGHPSPAGDGPPSRPLPHR
jgi:UDP-N-acetylglucosamine transferase subunit ALG13